jgi:hypothetical protein
MEEFVIIRAIDGGLWGRPRTEVYKFEIEDHEVDDLIDEIKRRAVSGVQMKDN